MSQCDGHACALGERSSKFLTPRLIPDDDARRHSNHYHESMGCLFVCEAIQAIACLLERVYAIWRIHDS